VGQGDVVLADEEQVATEDLPAEDAVFVLWLAYRLAGPRRLVRGRRDDLTGGNPRL